MTKRDIELPEQMKIPRNKLMRIRLIADIEKFEQQLVHLKNNGSYASFTDIQALKELIQARREMLNGSQ